MCKVLDCTFSNPGSMFLLTSEQRTYLAQDAGQQGPGNYNGFVLFSLIVSDTCAQAIAKESSAAGALAAGCGAGH